MGGLTIDPLHTPGHTDGHFAYRLPDRVFTGDAATLYRSVMQKLFSLSDDSLVYPARRAW